MILILRRLSHVWPPTWQGVGMRVGVGVGVGVASLALLAVIGPRPAEAQYIDARLIRKGALRIDFSPHYTNYDTRFAFGTAGVTDGIAEPLGTDLTADTVGSNLFPTLASAEEAIRAITGDATYRINVGAFNTVRDADVRHFPFGFALGLTDRITVRANLPIVTTRSQVTFTTDTTEANVGFNLAAPELGNATTVPVAMNLIDELGTAIADVEAAIAAGNFGCPTGAACVQAQATVARAMALLDNLLALTGIGAGREFVPFAPLASSTAGAAITAEIAAVAAALQALGATPVNSVLALPDARVGPDELNTLFTTPGLGFETEPIAFNRQTKFGDIEIGARFGLVTTPSARVVLTSTIWLPTGKPSSADNFVDIGTGDGQMDVELGIEAALQPGSSVGVSFGASYTMQLPHDLTRRITSPDAPLAPLSRRGVVTRDPGDVIRASAFPTIRLTSEFRVFASVSYYHKSADSFEIVSLDNQVGQGPAAELLERETMMTAWHFGGGIAYRSDLTGRVLPIEAGLNYRAAFSGSGGLTPKTNSMQIYLRLFYDLFLDTPPSGR